MAEVVGDREGRRVEELVRREGEDGRKGEEALQHDEVEVRLPLPAAVTKTDIKINVLPTSIEVFMKLGPKAKWEAKPLMEASSRATLLLRGTRAPHRP